MFILKLIKYLNYHKVIIYITVSKFVKLASVKKYKIISNINV